MNITNQFEFVCDICQDRYQRFHAQQTLTFAMRSCNPYIENENIYEDQLDFVTQDLDIRYEEMKGGRFIHRDRPGRSRHKVKEFFLQGCI